MNAEPLEVQYLYSKSIMTTFHAIWSLAGFTGAGLGYVMVTQHIDPSFHLLGVGVPMLAVTVVFFPMTVACESSKEKTKFFSMPDKTLLKFAVICFVSMACENTMYDWSGIYFQSVLHALQKITTAAFVFFMTAVTIGRFAGDYAVMRFGIKNILQYSAILVASGFIICFVLPFIMPTILAFVLIGIGVSCTIPLVFSITGKSSGLSSGTALASILTVGYLGFLVVPPMLGYISEVLRMKWAFLIMAVLAVVMIYTVNQISEKN